MSSQFLRQLKSVFTTYSRNSRKRKNRAGTQRPLYDHLEDRRLLAVVGGFNAATGALQISLTETGDAVNLSHDGTNVTFNGAVADIDPVTAGTQTASLASIRSITVTGDNTKTNQEILFSGNFSNSGGAALTSITVNNIRSAVFGGDYQLSNNLTVNLIQNGGQIGDAASGRVRVANLTALNSGDNPINMDNANNDFAGNVSLTTGGIVGRNANLADANNVSFSGVTVTGNLTVVAAGNVTDVTGATFFVGNIAMLTAANVTLGDSVGDTTNTTDIGFNVSGNVDYTEDSTVQLLSTTANNLTVRSSLQVYDSQSSIITVTGNATFNGQTRVRIGDNGTDRFNAGTVTFNSLGHVHITEDSEMNIVGVNNALNSHLFALGSISNAANSSLTVTNNLGLDANGSIDLGNATGDQLRAGAFYFYAPGAVSLNAESNIQLVQVNNEASTLALATPSTITDHDAAQVLVTGTTFMSALSVNVGDSNNDAFNSGSITFNTTGLFSLVENSDTVIVGNNTAGSALISSFNTLTNAENAVLNVAPNNGSSGNAAFFGSSGVNLGTKTNDQMNFTSLSVSTGAGFNATVSEDSATLLAGNMSVGSLTLSSAAAITNVFNANIVVQGFANLSGQSILIGGTTTDTFVSQTLSFNTTGSTNIDTNSTLQLVGTNRSGDQLILKSTGNITDSDTADTRVQTSATFTGVDIIIGELATDCFDILSGGIEKVTINASGVSNVVEANCA